MKSSRCSDEIFGLRLQMKLNPPPLTLRSKISSRSDFIHRRWISSANGGFSWKKHTFVLVDKCVLFSGAGYGSRTRLHGLGSRCITDIRTLHSIALIIAEGYGKFKSFLSAIPCHAWIIMYLFSCFFMCYSTNDAACNFFSRISRGLRIKIVPIRVDDHRLSDDLIHPKPPGQNRHFCFPLTGQQWR